MFSSPRGTKMFQFPRFASPNNNNGDSHLKVTGLSHSEIHGSKAICASPRLIAAYHVLHRLREPRHPPSALTLFRNRHSTHHTHATHTPRKKPEGTAHARPRRPLILSAVLSDSKPAGPKRALRNKGKARGPRHNCSLACHNMSKTETGDTLGEWQPEKWRITDSNR